MNQILNSLQEYYQQIFIGFLAIKLVQFLMSSINAYSRQVELQKIADNRRAIRDNADHETILFKKGFGDVNIDPFLPGHVIGKLFRENKLSKEKYLEFLIKRTRDIGHKKLNAITEELYNEALEHVSKKSSFNKSEVLSCIPVSIKDCIAQKGTDTTCGAAARCFKRYEEDAVLVKLLRDAGMIPYVRTNVPQLLLLPESDNNVWGCTNNPWDITRTPGGSSGGEGALIAAGCSVMGLGSDIGGSIRIPAHFNGIVGFKPTPGRISRIGMVNPRLKGRAGQSVILPTAGPLTRSVIDAINMMSAMCVTPSPANSPLSASTCLDTTLPPMLPFDVSACHSHNRSMPRGRGNKKLRVGYLMTDGYFEPCATVKRAMEESIDALRSLGTYELIPIQLPVDAKETFEVYCSLLAADGNWFSFMKGLEGESLHETYKRLWLYTNLPNWLRPLLSTVMSLANDHRKAGLVSKLKSGGMNVREYWERIGDKAEYCEIYKKFMIEERIDAILMPAVGLPAPPHGMIGDLLCAVSYCTIMNLLHWPSGVVPITTVEDDETHYNMEDLPVEQRDSYATLAHKAMQGSTGMPVGVQIATPPWKDELCLSIMGDLERVIDFQEHPDI